MEFELISLDQYLQEEYFKKLKKEIFDRSYPNPNFDEKELDKLAYFFKKIIVKKLGEAKEFYATVIRFIDSAKIIQFDVKLKNQKKSFILKKIKEKRNLITEVFFCQQFKEGGIKVPEIYYFNLKSKIIIYEYLGNSIKIGSDKIQIEEIINKLIQVHTCPIDKEKYYSLLGATDKPNKEFNRYIEQTKRNFKYNSLLVFENFDERIKKEILKKIKSDSKMIKDFITKNKRELWYNLNSSIDFKSNHIFLKDNQIYLIDFERCRPHGFLLLMQDLTSLLDYFQLNKKELENYLTYYTQLLSNKLGYRIDAREFIKVFRIFQFYDYLARYPTSSKRQKIFQKLCNYQFFQQLDISKKELDEKSYLDLQIKKNILSSKQIK